MPPFDRTSSHERNPVELLAEDFVERQRRGEHPSITEYTTRHPELAEAIRDLFPALVMIERLKPADQEDGLGEAIPIRPASQPGESMGHLGEYRLLREIARGGMGVVYEAVQESLGRHVALKVLPKHRWLDRPQIERFQLEARSAARLHHGHIVPVYGVGEDEGVHYYAMQFIHGHGLDAILADLRRLRGLARDRAEPRARPDPPRSGAEPTESLTVALSLLYGGFGAAAASADRIRHADGPAGTAPTLPVDGPDAAGLRGATPLIPAAPPMLYQPTTPRADPDASRSASVRAADATSERAASGAPSSLSLATEFQFYHSVTRVGLQVADALAYAHQQGVLHRDIKPSNLLLDAVGDVWVTDFGLAKLEGSDGPTRTGDIVGTVRYMAPERFERWSDRRSDVYSLGATLYELLTLRPLFEGAEEAKLIEKVLHVAPERPRKLDPKIPRDLETIILKAIAKEPHDRYPTAEALAEDLKRFLEDRPVLARRSTPVERFWRWCRRNRLLAGASITAAAAMLTLAIGAPIAAWKYREQLNQTRRAETQVRESLFDALLAQARAGRAGRRMGQRFESLDALGRAAQIARDLHWPSGRLDAVRDEAIACLALPDLKPTGPVIRRPPGLTASAFDPAMTRVALRFRDGTILVRTLADDNEIARFRAGGDRDIFVFRFSPDGRYLAATHDPGRALLVWDVERGVLVLNIPTAGGPAVRFSADTRRIALIKDNREVLLYDLATGQPSRRWPFTLPQDLALRADGTQIAIVHLEGGKSVCEIRDVESGRLVRAFPLMGLASSGMDWSPDGATLAVPSDDAKIYLWDAATGLRRAALAGHSNGGVITTFHPTGTVLASNGWENRLWLWDPVLGRPWLSMTGVATPDWRFGPDGRIALSLEDELTNYQVDPALEYRTFGHVSGEPNEYGQASICGDGRVLAAGTRQGVVLWDLARGSELGLLPIRSARHLQFIESRELLTSGSSGVWAWPIHHDQKRCLFQIGPPRRLRSFPAGDSGFAIDRSGRIVALADHGLAHVLTPEGAFQLGPLDDCRAVAVAPDGQWLATGSHGLGGVQIWRVRDAARVADLAFEGPVGVHFSPDGKWLMTTTSPCRLWEVGTWRRAREIGGYGLGFSADGALSVVQDAKRIIRLVETETGRTLAGLESPDLCGAWWATFTPDGARLVITTDDIPAVHVWDLRAIRRHLARLGLDWDGPPRADSRDAADDLVQPPPLTLKVDFGPLQQHCEQYQRHLELHTGSADDLLARYTGRLNANRDDVEALHLRGHALLRLGRYEGAMADFSAALALRPNDAHLRAWKGAILFDLKQYPPALNELESAFRSDPETVRSFPNLDRLLNNHAWELVTGTPVGRDPRLAVRLAALAVALAPEQQYALNTLGIAQYRAGSTAAAIETLEQSLTAGKSHFDGYDLYFLAMAHHRLAHQAQARACFDRGVRWLQAQKTLPDQATRELTAFRAEAEAVLAGPPGELPANVFAPLRHGDQVHPQK
jgi:serine/threonine protein kinase/WD40 repeat protein/tetratricopeptide (TPR) repeat protein